MVFDLYKTKVQKVNTLIFFCLVSKNICSPFGILYYITQKPKGEQIFYGEQGSDSPFGKLGYISHEFIPKDEHHPGI